MKTKLLLAIVSFVLVFTACQRTDFDELNRRIEQQKDGLGDVKTRLALLEAAMNTANTNISALQAITTALQSAVTIKSYTATATGYQMQMSNGTTIDLRNGKDGLNAPVIGTKLDTDGKYYWTLDGAFILQAGQKLPVMGKDGTNGTNGITPKLRVNSSNLWEISYDNGATWLLVKDAANNPVTATGATGPSGTSGLTITETNSAITITLNGSSYVIPKASATTNPADYRIVFATTKTPGSTVFLSIDAALTDRADVWLDLNNNNIRDANESVTNVGYSQFYTIGSNTITIHGKVTSFDCNSNNITALDVSKNTALTYLACPQNQISLLDVTNNTELTYLNCSINKLSSLDISKNTGLTELKCGLNQLSSLDISRNTALIKLDVVSNQLSLLDVSKNMALTLLYCYNNQLSSLDVTKNTALTDLACDKNQLSALDVSQNTALKYLSCFNNQLSSLDVTKNTALTYMSCYNNQLSSLDVTKNTALITLNCYNNQISSLDLSQNMVLNTLTCFNNQIKAAEMTKLILSLPQRLASAKGLAIVFDEQATPPNEGNAYPTPTDITSAKTGKNWNLYKYDTDSYLVLLN